MTLGVLRAAKRPWLTPRMAPRIFEVTERDLAGGRYTVAAVTSTNSHLLSRFRAGSSGTMSRRQKAAGVDRAWEVFVRLQGSPDDGNRGRGREEKPVL